MTEAVSDTTKDEAEDNLPRVKDDRRRRQATTLRWLQIGSFTNACTSSVLATAQTGLGLTLASSRAALLARMSMLVGVSAAA